MISCGGKSCGKCGDCRYRRTVMTCADPSCATCPAERERFAREEAERRTDAMRAQRDAQRATGTRVKRRGGGGTPARGGGLF